MAGAHDRSDRWMDENLREIGRRVQLPAEPTRQQRARWKQEAAAVDAAAAAQGPAPRTGGWIMRHLRLVTITGSAVAASILVLAFALFAPQGSVVQAATILSSLREQLFNGFRVSLENIGEDGVRVDGRMVVFFQPRPAGADPNDVPEIDAFYLDAHVRGDETATELSGLDLYTTLALSEEHQWLYLQVLGVSEDLVGDNPLADMVLRLTEQGLLLKLDGVLSEAQEALGDVLRGGPFAEAARRSAPAGVQARPEEGPDREEGVPGSGPDSTDVVIRGSSGSGAVDEVALARLIENFVRGRATADDIDAILALLEQQAQTVELTEVESGLFVLSIRDFRSDEAPVDDEDAALLERLEVEVGYRDGRGVEWATLAHVGEYDGTLRFALADVEEDRVLFDMERMIEPGRTTVLDVSGLAPLLQAVQDGDE